MKRVHLKAILNSYAEVFFLRDARLGSAFLLITLWNPGLFVSGILAVSSAYAIARFVGMAEDFLKSGFYTYNPLLVGLSIGYLFRLTPLTLLLIVIGGVSAFIVTAMFSHIFYTYLRLPVLSMPFVLISSVAYLAAGQYSNLYVTGLYPHEVSWLTTVLPLWVAGLFKSFGAIFFMPDVLPGMLIALVVLIGSRILFLLGVLGYFAGSIAVMILGGSYVAAFSSVNHFNFILIAMALGGVLLVPSLRSYWLALLAIGSSILVLSAVEVFWSLYGLPVFTLPFNLTTLSFLYVLGIVGYPLIPTYVGATPEETLDVYWTYRHRFSGEWRTVGLPFAGRWMVWQEFNGQWTHQGSWRYALDFVLTDEQGKTYRGSGKRLEDYYAFRKPVLSPVRGRVVKVVNNLPDNPIGKVDRENNWGNLVIIYDERGFFVELSHFAQHSIKVQPGAWVERGTLLGNCGNSGYSPQPHIHMQVQLTEKVGAPTVPFSVVSFVSDQWYYANAVPEEGAQVEALIADNTLVRVTSFVLDERFTYAYFEGDNLLKEVCLTVRMAPDGTFYLDSGAGQLFFGVFEQTFFFYRLTGNDPVLKTLFTALPQLPLGYKEGLQWKDVLPISVRYDGSRRFFELLKQAFGNRYQSEFAVYRFLYKQEIEGEVQHKSARVQLHAHRGFSEIQVDDVRLILRDYHASALD